MVHLLVSIQWLDPRQNRFSGVFLKTQYHLAFSSKMSQYYLTRCQQTKGVISTLHMHVVTEKFKKHLQQI
jgi:hypothetical protein